MGMFKVVLFVNYVLLAFVAGQEELNKDVEIISGKTHSNAHSLDARYIGHYSNDIYGPPVSCVYFCILYDFVRLLINQRKSKKSFTNGLLNVYVFVCWKLCADTRTKLASMVNVVGWRR